MSDISSNIDYSIQKMELAKLTKIELLEKCEELGIKNVNPKTKVS